jgi:hypothetical protein
MALRQVPRLKYGLLIARLNSMVLMVQDVILTLVFIMEDFAPQLNQQRLKSLVKILF